ncbi:hypothetical protein PR048_006494 [Dryococelus australis]|uniref:Uncharacterized protein n=1 Tax=Dryococelus australis TaxID=614101 RepID=A0ABQ9IB86_9NEOP|nr:hypothetical protein PR048_006494 [Dryococelus australis]
MKGWGKREDPEKTCRPAASYGTIPTCENPGVTRPVIEAGLPRKFAFKRSSGGLLELGRGDESTPRKPACQWLRPPRIGNRAWFVLVEVELHHSAVAPSNSRPPSRQESLTSTQSGGCLGARGNRLDHSPPTKANQVRVPAGTLPDCCMCESYRTMTLVAGFSRGSPVSPVLAFRRCSILTIASPSSALKTSILRAAQIFSLTHSAVYSADHKNHILPTSHIEGCDWKGQCKKGIIQSYSIAGTGLEVFVEWKKDNVPGMLSFFQTMWWVIKRAVHKNDRIYSPNEYEEIIQSARELDPIHLVYENVVGHVKASEFIDGLVKETLKLKKQDNVSLSNEKTYIGKLPISPNKRHDVYKDTHYVPEEYRLFYEEILRWPTWSRGSCTVQGECIMIWLPATSDDAVERVTIVPKSISPILLSPVSDLSLFGVSLERRTLTSGTSGKDWLVRIGVAGAWWVKKWRLGG